MRNVCHFSSGYFAAHLPFLFFQFDIHWSAYLSFNSDNFFVSSEVVRKNNNKQNYQRRATWKKTIESKRRKKGAIRNLDINSTLDCELCFTMPFTSECVFHCCKALIIRTWTYFECTTSGPFYGLWSTLCATEQYTPNKWQTNLNTFNLK